MGKLPAKPKAPAEWIKLDPPEIWREIQLRDNPKINELNNVTHIMIEDTKVCLRHGVDEDTIFMYPMDQLVFTNFKAAERTI